MLTVLALNGSLQDKSNYQRASTTPLPQTWINFHAFAAIVASSGIFGDDFAMESGLTVIVAAFEKKSPTGWERDTNIPAATQWLLHASKVISRNGKLWERIGTQEVSCGMVRKDLVGRGGAFG
jgi:hypothetical protein